MFEQPTGWFSPLLLEDEVNRYPEWAGLAAQGAERTALSLVGGLIENFQDVLSGSDEVVKGGSTLFL